MIVAVTVAALCESAAGGLICELAGKQAINIAAGSQKRKKFFSRITLHYKGKLPGFIKILREYNFKKDWTPAGNGKENQSANCQTRPGWS